MKECNIILSKTENYLNSAIKIKSSAKIKVNIIWIEEFMMQEEKEKRLENSILYFLCNTPLVKELVDLLENTNCYIFNEEFLKKNDTKLEIQEMLIKNQIDTPKIITDYKEKGIKIPIFCKENSHAGMVFQAYTKSTIEEFFEKFDTTKFYLEEVINGEEVKYYYVNQRIYAKDKLEISDKIRQVCKKVANLLRLEVFSIDFIKSKEGYKVIDVNPAAGFYMLDSAREDLINEIERMWKR